MSESYLQILNAEVSYHICTSQWPVIKVNANFYA